MQIKLFTIPIGDSGAAVQEMNAFLRGNKILEVENKLVSNEHGAYWCFCVRYIERAYGDAGEQKGTATKMDYKKVLDEATFQKFSMLRETRKKVAAEEGISAFIIFTDEELAELAKLGEIRWHKSSTLQAKHRLSVLKKARVRARVERSGSCGHLLQHRKSRFAKLLLEQWVSFRNECAALKAGWGILETTVALWKERVEIGDLPHHLLCKSNK